MNPSIYVANHANTKFVVKNIAANGKRVRIFQYPVPNGGTRDLLSIPGISEADIRHSLLKGELLLKLQSGEIRIVDSDIDLLQFNAQQKEFLQASGITNGLEIDSISGGSLTANEHERLRQLIHLADGVGGPMEGFSGAYRETLPLDEPFPTTIVWWESANKDNKLMDKNLFYDDSARLTSIVWRVYNQDGSVLATVTDTLSYNGDSPFEGSRTRTVT